MPSPFPGMDPYLETPGSWPNIHHGLISEMQAELNRQLRPKYFANIEERVYLSDWQDPGHGFVVPNVHIVTQNNHSVRENASGLNGIAVIEPIEVETLDEDEVHEARIEIVDALNRSIVTVIEVLSPSNKLAGSSGRESYHSKRYKVMRSSSHLVEIDLLRGGLRIYIREKTPPYDYLVHVSKVSENGRRRAKIWPIPLHLPLPIIPIPLKHGDPDARVDLQMMLASAYERGAFDLKIDYQSDAVPPLTADQTKWARQLISASKPT